MDDFCFAFPHCFTCPSCGKVMQQSANDAESRDYKSLTSIVECGTSNCEKYGKLFKLTAQVFALELVDG